MNKTTLISELFRIYTSCPGNVLTVEAAISPELAGISFYEEPLVGFAAADDPLFDTYQLPDVIGPWHKKPKEWLPEAATVISMFLPFTEDVLSSNRMEKQFPSAAWLHARVEGQAFLNIFADRVAQWLREQGYAACVPCGDVRFVCFNHSGIAMPGLPEGVHTSNWSERHAAYACGLGTFGLSKGIITEKGMAGRFCSVITSLPVEPDQRPYTDPYEYCIRCGACVRRCPVNAISVEHGKAHGPCAEHVHHSLELYDPRYGCGLCQTGVPCERKKPQKLR